MRAIVWSKNNCPYCDQAKALLKLKGIEFEEKNIEQDYSREQLLQVAPNARTVPQVFLDGRLIGGFVELSKYFQNS
jgi:glutaredoxin